MIDLDPDLVYFLVKLYVNYFYFKLNKSNITPIIFIGLAKAALEAVNGFNLFGERGSISSVIYVDIDAHNRNRSIFMTLLPRESNTKVSDVTKLFEDFGGTLCKEFIIGRKPVLYKAWNLYQSSTTLGLDPVSSGPPQTNKLHNVM